MMEDKNLDDALAAAVEDNIKQWPLTGPQKPAERVPENPAPQAGGAPRRAADQLSLCVAGLFKIEEELIRLTDELVGPMAEEQARADPGDRPTAIFDRLRGDARMLADLAIRLDRRLRHLRERM